MWYSPPGGFRWRRRTGTIELDGVRAAREAAREASDEPRHRPPGFVLHLRDELPLQPS